MTILCTSDDGVFFEPQLLEDVKSRKNAEILVRLQDEKNPWQLSDSSGRTLLHFAAEYGNDILAQHLIDLGAEVDAQDRMKQTPIMLAIDAKKMRLVDVLLEAGADVLTPVIKGQCASRRVTPTDPLKSLKESQYVHSDAFHRAHPLYHFMQLNDTNVTRFLLEVGSPVNAKDPYTKETALHMAVKCNSLENVKLLLEYGADVDVEAHCGRTPLLHVSQPGPHWDERITLAIMKLLLDRSDALNDSTSQKQVMTNLLMYGNRGIIGMLLQYPIDWSQFRGNSGMTPLHYLCHNHNANIFDELRHLDFDVNLRDRFGYILLHYAAATGNASSVQFLVDRGADVNSEDCNMKTPLFTILDESALRYNNYVQCVEILLLYGADPQLFKGDDDSLDYATISDELITPVFAKLALLEASGRPINTFTRNCIESKQQLKSTFDAVKLQLEQMKQIEIVPSVTLLDFMTTGKISRFARNKELISNLTEVMKSFRTTSYYDRVIRRRYSQLSRLIELREALVPVVNEVLIEYCNLSLCNVADQIIDCLHDEQCKERL